LARSERHSSSRRSGGAAYAAGVRPGDSARLRLRFLATCALLVVVAGCTEIDRTLARVPVFAFMHDVPSFDPHENPRPAPPGSVPYESPLGEVFAPLEGTEVALQAFAAGPHGTNPWAHDEPSMLEIGRVMYDRHCAVCHGITGMGDGPIIGPGLFPLAPDLVEGPAVGQSDGYMYAIIRAGRGLMPSYGGRIAHHERWAIVNYVRALQGGGTAATASPAQPLPQLPADTQPAPAAPGAAPPDTGIGQGSR
jgi:mono/diheme cytochrome c family protein